MSRPLIVDISKRPPMNDHFRPVAAVRELPAGVSYAANADDHPALPVLSIWK